MAALLAELDRQKAIQNGTHLSEDRRAQNGSGQRGDKIRTYRFQDNVSTDHRTGRKAQTDRVFAGRFDLFRD
jgi:peptide chain release factor 1